MLYTARRYRTTDGKEPFTIWFKALRDIKAKVMILKRIERLEGGNFGACKPCRNGGKRFETVLTSNIFKK